MGYNEIDIMMKNVIMSEDLKNKIISKTVNYSNHISVRKMFFRKVILVAMLCIAALGTVTTVAAISGSIIYEQVTGKESIFYDFLQGILGNDKGQRKKLEEDGYVQNMEVNSSNSDVTTATADGITVTMVETLCEGTSLVVYMRVESDSVVLNGNCGFEIGHVSGGDAEPLMVCTLTTDVQNDNEDWIEVVCAVPEDKVLEDGCEIELELCNFMIFETLEDTVETKLALHGPWKFNWTLSSNDNRIIVPVNTTIQDGEHQYPVDCVEITPVSYKVVFSEVVKQSFDDESGFYDIKFVMKDGSIHDATKNYGSYGEDYEYWLLHDVLDIDELYSVILEDREFLVE